MRRAVVSVPFLVATLAVSGASAFAQTSPREPVDFRHATTLGVSAGGAVDGEQAGAAAGGLLGWQVSPRIAIEGFGRWFPRDHGSDAFAAAFAVQANVWSTRATSMFVAGGLGMYHVDFDSSAHAMPAFYRHRMSSEHGPVSSASFTDPAIVAGGGLQFTVSRQVIVRPFIDTTIVPAQSRCHFVTTFAVSLAYRFERHPVTAARRSE